MPRPVPVEWTNEPAKSVRAAIIANRERFCCPQCGSSLTFSTVKGTARVQCTAKECRCSFTDKEAVKLFGIRMGGIEDAGLTVPEPQQQHVAPHGSNAGSVDRLMGRLKAFNAMKTNTSPSSAARVVDNNSDNDDEDEDNAEPAQQQQPRTSTKQLSFAAVSTTVEKLHRSQRRERDLEVENHRLRKLLREHLKDKESLVVKVEELTATVKQLQSAISAPPPTSTTTATTTRPTADTASAPQPNPSSTKKTFASVCKAYAVKKGLDEGKVKTSAAKLRAAPVTKPRGKADAKHGFRRVYVSGLKYAPYKEIKACLFEMRFVLSKVYNIAFIARSVAEFTVADDYAAAFERQIKDVGFKLVDVQDPSKPIDKRAKKEIADRVRAAFVKRTETLVANTKNPRLANYFEALLKQTITSDSTTAKADTTTIPFATKHNPNQAPNPSSTSTPSLLAEPGRQLSGMFSQY